MSYQNKKVILCYNEKDNKEFRRIEDILNILKMKYEIEIKYNKIKENKLFIIIENRKLDVNHTLDFYINYIK